MATKAFTPLLGKRIRVVELDSCGNVPASGAPNSMAVSSGFMTVSLSAEVEDGAEIITKRADGAICVNEMTNPSFKRFTMEIEFCGVDPGLASLLTNAEPYLDYNDDEIGIVASEGEIDKRFAFELWTGLSGEACEEGVEEASGYLLLPFVNAGVIGDIEVTGEDAVTFSMTGAFTRGGNGWAEGPFNVVQGAGGSASALPTPLDPLDHFLFIRTGLTPPPAADGTQPFIPTAA